MNSIIKKTIFLVSLLLSGYLFLSPLLAIKNTEPLVGEFERILVQHEGRLKPMDTVARIYLLIFSGRTSFKGKSASEWLLNTLSHTTAAYDEKVFKINNPDILSALKITTPEKDHYYSFNQIREPLQAMHSDFSALYAKPKTDRTRIEDQLLEVYMKTIRYFDIGRTFAMFVPDIVVGNEQLAKDLELVPGVGANYFHFVRKTALIYDKIRQLNAVVGGELSEEERSLVDLITILNAKKEGVSSLVLSIMPAAGAGKWSTPWELMDKQETDIREKTMLDILNKAFLAMYAGDTLTTKYMAEFNEMSPSRENVSLELYYNKGDFFYRSLYCYIGALLLLMSSWLFWPLALGRISFSFVVVGALLHLVGLVLRMFIMGRPPVSNLYESIIFVGFIAVASCIFLECRRKNSLGIFAAALCGSLLHFVGFSYASDGDTMGMLVAVLDSNFWLATHVVTITIGYGTAIVAGILAHVYLFLRNARRMDSVSLSELFRNLLGLALVSLFFTTLGTILGGIWADQSWGRFWGWDPKENGALLIVLWFLALIHGRLCEILKETGFAIGLVLGNVVVAVAWFGVNLLNVGLHTYGFTDNIATNLLAFCLAEVVLAIAFSLTSPRQVISP